MSEQLYKDTQDFLDSQSPHHDLLTKDRFGGIDTEKFTIKSNYFSKRIRSVLWLENLVLFSSVFELGVKTVAWLSLGSFIGVMCQISLWASVASLPLVWAVLGLVMISKGTPLRIPALYILMIVVFSFVLSFF